MTSLERQFEDLRLRIASRNEPDTEPEDLQYLAVTSINGTFDLDFFGDPWGEAYSDLLHTLARSDVAARLRSFRLRGPDEGMNGTRNWDIRPLFSENAEFPKLELLHIQLNQPADHNRTIIGEDFEENGVLAKLLSRSPQLRSLTVPSAPNADFFRQGERPIRFLSVDAGYDTQDFITNLANSSCFPDLTCFEWGEYHETYIDGYLESCTRTAAYRDLFQADAFANVIRFVWRNPVCSPIEIRRLHMLKPKLQMLIVRSSDDYA